MLRCALPARRAPRAPGCRDDNDSQGETALWNDPGPPRAQTNAVPARHRDRRRRRCCTLIPNCSGPWRGPFPRLFGTRSQPRFWRSLLERSAPRLFCASGPALSAAFCRSGEVERPGERNNLENHGFSSINHVRPFAREQQVEFQTFVRRRPRHLPALRVFQSELVAKDSATPHFLDTYLVSPALAAQLAGGGAAPGGRCFRQIVR